MAARLPLPSQPADVAWPTEAWPTAAFDRPVVAALVAEAFGPESRPELGETHGVVVVRGGKLVLEVYGSGFDPDATCRSWSMAKSITHALVGLAVFDGRLDINAPAAVPAWRVAGDPRGAITLDHLLRMSSGLAWIEDYAPGHASDVVEMLFGAGKDDVAAFAESKPAAHPPGDVFYYSSGTTNIICGILERTLGLGGEGFEAFMRERLFGPLGMTSASPRFDAAGTFIGSSFCFCTPRDFARFGLLYLRDGVWNGQRLLPEGWVDYARTPTFQQPDGDADGPYGAHWWLDRAGAGSFSACGYEGQHIAIIPQRDLIIVRNGVTPLSSESAARLWVSALADAID
jgi:CubicO group peptidase (beta-lactamase class C family)